MEEGVSPEKGHIIDQKVLDKILDKLKSNMKDKNLAQYVRGFKKFYGQQGWTGKIYIHTPESAEVEDWEWDRNGLKWMKSLNESEDKDVSGTDNKDLCDEATVSSEKELRAKMRGMKISAEDKKKIEKEIGDMRKGIKDLDVDKDVTNTYMRRIQNMLCTFSKEDKQNIDESLSFANILNENRIEDSIKMFYSPEDADTAWYQQLLNIDPSGEHAYLIPLLSLIKKEYPEIFKPDGRMSRRHLYIQDLTATLGETLKYFHNYKNRFNKETIHKAIKSIYPDSKVAYNVLEDLGDNLKDMASYSSLDVFKFIVDSVRHLPSAKEIRDIKKSGSKKIYDDEDYLVVVPETEAASCYYGAGTQWCTAGRSSNAFEDYTGRQGVLYYIIYKKTTEGVKNAIHMTFDHLLSDDVNYANYTVYDEEDQDVDSGKYYSEGDLETNDVPQNVLKSIEKDYEQRASKMKEEIDIEKEKQKKSEQWSDDDEYMNIEVIMTEEGKKTHGKDKITFHVAVSDDEWEFEKHNHWDEVADFLIFKMEQVLDMKPVSDEEVEKVVIKKTYGTRQGYCAEAMRDASYGDGVDGDLVCGELKTYSNREVLDVIGTNMPADTWKEVAAANGYEEISHDKWYLPQLGESTKLSFANILNEGRVDDAEKFFDEGIYGKIGSNERSWTIPTWFDKLKKIDPSGNQAYLLPILRLLRKGFPAMKGLLSAADNQQMTGLVDSLENTLLYFHHHKDRFTSDGIEVELETLNRPGMTIEDEDKLIAAPRDIANYWSLHLFNLLVSKMMAHPSSKEKREILKSGVKKIYDDENVLVVVPETIAASCYYGSGTKWCTASTKPENNQFGQYHGTHGVLYYIIFKKLGEKYALSIGFDDNLQDGPSYTLYDAKDERMVGGHSDPEKAPYLKVPLARAIHTDSAKKHNDNPAEIRKWTAALRGPEFFDDIQKDFQKRLDDRVVITPISAEGLLTLIGDDVTDYSSKTINDFLGKAYQKKISYIEFLRAIEMAHIHQKTGKHIEDKDWELGESKLSLTGIILTEGRLEDAQKKWLTNWFKSPQPGSKFKGKELNTRKHFAEQAFIKFVELGKNELADTNNKYLDWMMNVFLNKSASYMDIKNAVILFHKVRDKIQRAMLNTRAIPGIHPDNLRQFQKAPADINTYGGAGSLIRVAKHADQYVSRSDLQKIIKKEAKVIYKDDRFEIIEPITHRASCHFGRDTKWCTTEKGSDNYFNQHTKGDQRLLYIIDKSKTPYDTEDGAGDDLAKVALHIDDNGKTVFYDAKDKSIEMQKIMNKETGLIDKVPLFTKMWKSNIYGLLKSFKSTGKPLSELEDYLPGNVYSNNIIDDIDSEGNIYIQLGPDVADLGKYMGWDEWITRGIENATSHYGHQNEYYDSYQLEDDWDEGYILGALSNKSVEKLKEYLEVSDPKALQFFKNPSERSGGWDTEGLADHMKLSEVHTSVVDDMQEAYMHAEDISMERGIEKYVEETLRTLLDQFGLYYEEDFIYKTTLDNLIELFEDAPTTELNIQRLMMGLGAGLDGDGGFWEEDFSGYENKDHDIFNEEYETETLYAIDRHLSGDLHDAVMKMKEAWDELARHDIYRNTLFDLPNGKKAIVISCCNEGDRFEVNIVPGTTKQTEPGTLIHPETATKRLMKAEDVVKLKTMEELPFPEDEEENIEEQQINELGQSYDGEPEGDEFNQAYLKVAKIVDSADTLGQLKVARRVLDQLEKKYPKMDSTTRDYRFLSGSIIRKEEKLRNLVETYETDVTVRKIAKIIGGDLRMLREDHSYDLWVDGRRKKTKKNFTLSIDDWGVMSYETLEEEKILGHVAEGTKKLTRKVIDVLNEETKGKNLLTEGRIEDAKKKYSTFISKPMWDRLIHGDPTGNHKYLMWAAKMITQERLGVTSMRSLIEELRDFYELSKKGIVDNKDINTYKTIDEFVAVIDVAKTRMSKSEMKRQIKDKDIELIYDEDPGVKIYVPKTKAASCLLGVNTKWCTASKTSKNYFDQYTREGFLFYIFAGGSNPRKWALHVDQNGKREFWNAQDMKMDSFDLTEEEEIAVETYMDNHEDEKWDEINKRLKVAVDTAVKHLHIDRTRIGEVVKTSEPYMNFVSYEIRYYPGTEGDVPQWVDVKVFNDSDLKAYVKDFVDTDFAGNDAGLILGYQNGHLEDAINKGWFDYDKYMEEEAENDLYDEDGGFLPDSKSQKDILEFIEDDVSMDTIGNYINMEKIYKSYEDSLELTVPDPIAQVKEGEYTLLLTSP
tara:strand:+ start:29 stop:6784 length:6756 start_codon:yes stop_codon:yes gene_type:complete